MTNPASIPASPAMSIKVKLTTILVLSITLVFAIYFAFQYVTKKERLYSELDAHNVKWAEYLSKSLAIPVWNYNVDFIQGVVDSAMRERDIYSILVKDPLGNVLFGRQKDGNGNIVEARSAVAGGDKVQMAPILQGNEKIGDVEVRCSAKLLEERLRSELLSMFLVLSVLSASLIGALFFGVNRIIIQPLNHVVDKVRIMASGELDRPVVVESNDEIGQLASDMDAMRLSILQSQEALLENEERLRQLNEELEQRVLERTTQLKAANAELEAFAYSVSHDLRTPLRAIDGFSTILIRDYSDALDAKAVDYLSRVRNNAQDMAALIDDMLQLSRISRLEMNNIQVDLSAMAREIMAKLREHEPGRNVEVQIDSRLMVTGDAGLLHILLENLLGNAWKYTSRTERPRIEFGIEPADSGQAFFIRDNGAGFDMRYSSKLFAAFQRLHNDAEFPGTGIGLATAQRVVARHNGQIWAEGKIGQGACFYFTLGTWFAE